MSVAPVEMIEQLAGDYQTLRGELMKRFDLPPLEAVRIEVQFDSCGDLETAVNQVVEYEAACEGWSRRESWAGCTPAQASDDAGAPLDGEWLLNESASVRLICAGDTWRFITTTEGHQGGVPVLKEIVKVQGRQAPKPARSLVYAVYWGAPESDPVGLKRLAWRFVGFEAGGED